MAGFLLGLAVALGGALLLASGSELQSAAVYSAPGGWRGFVKSPRWLWGAALLGTAVCTNFIALALAPISAVQSMSIVALAASAAFGALTGRIQADRRAVWSIVACVAGISGFITVIAANPGLKPRFELDRQLPAVFLIQAVVAVVGLAMAGVTRTRTSRPLRFAGLIVGAVGFGATTGVLKVIVGLVLRDGIGNVLTRPLAVLALLSTAVGAAVAGAHVQMAHRVLPAPTVVAGLTITDTITAATIGTLVLRESALTLGAAILLFLAGSVAFGGVIGLRKLRRKSESTDSAAPPSISPGRLRQESTEHACRVLQ
ncbi:MAG: hypothetical protein LBD77_00570 [Bifidobacteriaceae bacterium]|jgi:hypothetical protein|nr:hypothetical protein [Bifidobacteriaceae bacterium]